LIGPPQNLQSEGWTCIVGGIAAGFNNYNSTNGGRPATRKAVIIVTDGNGNRPCSTRTVDVSPGEDCSQWDQTIINTNCTGCGGRTSTPCDGNYCCQSVHDWQLKYFYLKYYALTSPTIYAVGVGGSSDISEATLRLIVNDPTAIARGDPRIFRVNSWFSLGSILTALAKALLCDVPGAETCPNDCRPGGFCCAGACLCSIDCSLQSSECQAGTCRADKNGASCVLGAPDNSSCQDPRIQCQDRYCVAGSGCIGFPNNNKNCTDNNNCTDDVCQGGTCISTRNTTIDNCDDHNGCTLNDKCQPDGSCKGIKDDSANCTDGNACTADRCFNATCISVNSVVCTDTNADDCIKYKCNPATGDCDPVPITPGFYCRDPSTIADADNCTVYICSRFDPEAWATCIDNNKNSNTTDRCNTGKCIKATRDLDRCKSSSINTAGIIGGVIAGVAFLAIIALAIIILILFLLRKKVIDVLGSLNPFGKDVFVHENPTHVNPVTSHTVPAELSG